MRVLKISQAQAHQGGNAVNIWMAHALQLLSVNKKFLGLKSTSAVSSHPHYLVSGHSDQWSFKMTADYDEGGTVAFKADVTGDTAMAMAVWSCVAGVFPETIHVDYLDNYWEKKWKDFVKAWAQEIHDIRDKSPDKDPNLWEEIERKHAQEKEEADLKVMDEIADSLMGGQE